MTDEQKLEEALFTLCLLSTFVVEPQSTAELMVDTIIRSLRKIDPERSLMRSDAVFFDRHDS